MKKKAKVILGSVMTMAMCATLITGATLALFTSQSNVNIAVTSGKVDVEASISGLYTYSNATEDIPVVSIDGWQEAVAEGDGFAGTFAMGGKAVYTAGDGAGNLSLTNILPGDAAKFTFSVVNNSTVSIRYQVRVVVGKEESTDENDAFPDKQLSSALELTFNGGTIKGFHEAATAWSEPVTGTDDGMTQDMIIRLPKDAGDEYQTKKCEIALTVVAVQGNGDTSHYCEINGGHFYDDSTGACIYCGAANPFAAHHSESADTYTITGVDEGVTDVVIPAEINGKKVELEGGAFANNPDLQSVKIEGNITELPAKAQSGYPRQLGLFAGCSALASVELPEGLTTIGDYAFSGCTKLKDINIPSSVTEIKGNAFENTAIESFTIGENMKKMGSSVLRNCSALKEITFEGGTVTMAGGVGSFSWCKNVERIYFPDLEFWFKYGAYTGSSLINNLSCKDANPTIYINGEPLEGTFTVPTGIKSIKSNILQDYQRITKIVIPDEVIDIDLTRTFASCDAITEVQIGSGIQEISSYAFNACTNLQTVTFAQDCKATIGSYAFANAKALENLDLGGITKIGTCAFMECGSLERVVIPGSCEVIGNTVPQPNGEVNSRDGAFEGCTKLKYFEMKEGVKTLGVRALFKCTALETVVIPSTLETVVGGYYHTPYAFSDLFGYFHEAKYGRVGNYGPNTTGALPGTGKNVTVYFHGTKDQLIEKEWYKAENDHNYQLHGEDAEKKYCRDEDVDWFYLSETSKTGEEDKYWNYNEEGVPTPWETV